MILCLAAPGSIELFIIGVVSFIIGIFITRWLFRINTIVHYMHAQTRLLAKMAKAAGVDENEIRDVLGIKRKNDKTNQP